MEPIGNLWIPKEMISDVELYVSMNKLLNMQSSCRWFEMPWFLCDKMVPSMPT